MMRLPRTSPTPIPKSRTTLKDRFTQLLLSRALIYLLDQLKESKLIESLKGYKTYITAILIVLAAAAEQFLGVDLPGFEMDVGTAVAVALGLIFARNGAKSEAKAVADRAGV